MNNSFPNKLQFYYIYMFIWIILTIIQIYILNYYCVINYANSQYILSDSIVCNILQAGCILTLWYPAKFFRNVFNLPLTFLFHTLLFLIYSVIWLGLGYLITQSILINYAYFTEFFLTILPLKIVFSLLIYIIFVLISYLLMSYNDLKIQKQAFEEKETASTPQPVEKLNRIIVKKNSEFHCITINQIRYI